jgi:hypothetical protein
MKETKSMFLAVIYEIFKFIGLEELVDLDESQEVKESDWSS